MKAINKRFSSQLTLRNSLMTAVLVGATALLSACGDGRSPSSIDSPIASSQDDLNQGDTVNDQATVFKSNLEGGFYYLRTSEGKVYVPVGIPEELKVEGAFVNFTATLLKDTYSPIMAGELVRVDSFSYPTE